MIGTSLFDYAWLMTWVVILHSIGPLSTIYCLVAKFLPESLRVWRFLEYWLCIETGFFFLTYGYRKLYLQRPALHPPPPEKEERNKLFRLCFDSSPDLAASFSRWFLGAPLVTIRRENIKDWFRWAFLNTDMDDPTLDDEVEIYVKQLEVKLGMNFQPGRADVKSIRLTLDKVDALHRSVIWYTCIFVVDILTHAYLRFHGFDFYRGSITHTISVIPPRPQAFIARHLSPGHKLSYWYHPHTSKKELPVVFLHGIGAGLYPYMQLLKEVNQGRRHEDGKIGILAVEILAISSRITPPVLRKEDMCQQLELILRHHGFEKFVLVSHSYSSVISTYLLRTADLARRVSSVILVDPISILLHEPDVVYNFTMRRPKLANEWLLWFFGSKDIGVAHTLSRTFFWSQNILWKEDLLGHHVTVFLGEKDSVINATKVRRYLEGVEEHDTGKEPERNGAKDPEKNMPVQYECGCLGVVWCADLDHGQVFDLAPWRGRLKIEILRKVRCTL